MKVYVIGDSISIQYGPYLERVLRGTIGYARKEGDEAHANLDYPQGANGGDSSMVLAYLRERAKSGGIDADVLVVNCGLHDIKTDPQTGVRQVSIEQYGQNLKEIVQIAQALGCRLVWVRTTPCDEAVHNHNRSSFHRFSRDCIAYNAVADEIMAQAGVPSIDLYTFTLNLGPDLYCDHVHFHEAIRMQQGAFIAGFLSAL